MVRFLTLARGWLCWTVWRYLLPDKLAFGPVGHALLPFAGEWIYREEARP